MQITFFSECPNILILYIKQLNNKTFIFYNSRSIFIFWEYFSYILYIKVLRDNLLVNIHKEKTY